MALNLLLRAARLLAPLPFGKVYVGAAVLPLYLDVPTRPRPLRPTDDVDVAIDVLTVSHLERFREALTLAGFRQRATERVICRFHGHGLVLDVMSREGVDWAPANRWFRPGWTSKMILTIEDVRIPVLDFPYYLATKIDAFSSRGVGDALFSKDLEDIVQLLTMRSSAFQDIVSAPAEVSPFLLQWLRQVVKDEDLRHAIRGHLPYHDTGNGMERLMERVRQAAEG
jgi:hypothetical protein